MLTKGNTKSDRLPIFASRCFAIFVSYGFSRALMRATDLFSMTPTASLLIDNGATNSGVYRGVSTQYIPCNTSTSIEKRKQEKRTATHLCSEVLGNVRLLRIFPGVDEGGGLLHHESGSFNAHVRRGYWELNALI